MTEAELFAVCDRHLLADPNLRYHDLGAGFYDSRVNLVARGIIREATTHPRPFPGFVPDPAG